MNTAYKRWLTAVVIGIAIICITMAGLNIWNDPLFQYTDSEASEGYRGYYDATYQNPGIAKDLDYEGIITGSSMTQNFDPTYFEELFGCKFKKLSYSGGNAKNVTSIIHTALRSNGNVRYVFSSLDGFAFMNEWTSEGNQSPDYLLNDRLYDDVSYVFNKYYLFDYTLKNLKQSANNQESIPPHQRFTWYGFVYGDKRLTDLEPRKDELMPALEKEYYIQNTRDNLVHYWIPLIKQYPTVQFYLFFPPYSILSWHSTYMAGHLDAELGLYEEIASEICTFTNVKLFGFQNIEALITNLYNYKDTQHYHFRINDYMTRCFLSEVYLMNTEDIHDYYIRFKQFVENFNCDFFYDNQLMNTTGISQYLDLLQDERYTVFISSIAAGDYSVDSWLIDKLNILGLEADAETFLIQDVAAIVHAGSCEKTQIENVFRGNVESIGYDKRVLFGMETINEQKYQRVEIDGVIYSPNAPGLNFVVYDNLLGRVVDSVAFSLDGVYTADRLHAWSDFPQIRQCWRQDEWMGDIEKEIAG